MADYGNAAEFFGRYPAGATQVTTAQVHSNYLFYASRWIESALGGGFTLPFTATNQTALELVYTKALHFHRLRTLKADDSQELGGELDRWVSDIRCGASPMVLSSGETLFWSDASAQPGETAFSTAMNYNPVFTLDESERQEVDPNLLSDLRAVRE